MHYAVTLLTLFGVGHNHAPSASPPPPYFPLPPSPLQDALPPFFPLAEVVILFLLFLPHFDSPTHRSKAPSTVRIPLAEVVRFKEKQWFVEELEGSREGDANAMLRLAKVCAMGGWGNQMGRSQGWARGYKGMEV